MKSLTYQHPYLEFPVKVAFEKATYLQNNSLYLGLIVAEDDPENDIYKGEPWSDITVNLGSYLGENDQFVDTNNNPNIDKWLEENGLAKPITYPNGEILRGISGWCSYPAYTFNLEKINEYLYKEVD